MMITRGWCSLHHYKLGASSNSHVLIFLRYEECILSGSPTHLYAGDIIAINTGCGKQVFYGDGGHDCFRLLQCSENKITLKNGFVYINERSLFDFAGILTSGRAGYCARSSFSINFDIPYLKLPPRFDIVTYMLYSSFLWGNTPTFFAHVIVSNFLWEQPFNNQWSCEVP